METLDALFGTNAETITWWQMCVRALVVACYAIVLFRVASRRIVGRDAVLDVVWLAEDRRTDMMEWLAGPEKAPPPVQSARGRCIKFEWDRRRLLRLDDRSVEEAPDEGPALVTVQLDGRPFDVLVAPGAA